MTLTGSGAMPKLTFDLSINLLIYNFQFTINLPITN